jgi:hypothetical protein
MLTAFDGMAAPDIGMVMVRAADLPGACVLE